MSTSGTYAFNPRASELAIEIFERVGIRAAEATVDQMISMARSMNLTLQSWSNRGINLFTRELISQALTQGTATYDVPARVIDVLPNGTFIRTTTGGTNTDRIMAPISRDDYAAQPNKDQQGFPTVWWFNRLINPEITVWEVPDQNGPYVMMMNCDTQIQDVSPTGTQTVAIPPRFFEAFVSGVAGNFAIKWAVDKAPALIQYGKDMWAEAAREDSERVTTMIIPQLASYYRA